jgi:pimeloyl-ACP methyl ester carboxylesterase
LPPITEPALEWIDKNRRVVKTRLLDLSQALHSEVDRPDAEATFRMGLWPPFAAIALYLAVAESPLWALGLALPIVLAVQWLALRRTANDALVTAIAAKDQTREMLISGAYGVEPQPPSLASCNVAREPAPSLVNVADEASAMDETAQDEPPTDEAEDRSAQDDADGVEECSFWPGSIEDPGRLLLTVYAAAGWTSLPWLHRITAPTLVVAGDDDPSVPVANARMLAARRADARVHVLKGGGHLFLLDEPQNAIAPILSFLDADL